MTGGLFDGEETSRNPVPRKTAGDRLPTASLFDEEPPTTVTPKAMQPPDLQSADLQSADLQSADLQSADLQSAAQPGSALFDSEPQNTTLEPLFGIEPWPECKANIPEPTSVTPVLLDDTPAVPQRVIAHPPEPVRLDDSAPAAPQSVVKAPEPQEIFASEEDPLVTQALRHAKDQFPDIFDQERRTLKSRFESLFPLDFDRISQYAEKTLRHVPTVMQEVTQSSETLSTLSVPAVIQEISAQAQAAAGGGAAPGHGGLSGLLKKVESRVRPFDPQVASNRLMQLYGGVKSIHSRLSGVNDLANDVFTQIQTDIRVLSVLKVVSEKTPVETAVQRRHDLLLVTGQQMRLGMKQLEALRGQTENSLMQIEEMRTVTLPSLGFLGAIR